MLLTGSNSGLETRLRSKKAPHLQDIDGDSWHYLHNAAKHFWQPFDGTVEALFRDIHNDKKWSPDLRDALSSICECMSVKYTAPDV